MEKLFLIIIIPFLFIPSNSYGQEKEPKHVYHLNLTKTLPFIYHFASKKNISIPKYKFPKRKNKYAIPADVFLKIYRLYSLIKKDVKLPEIKRKLARDVRPVDVYKISSNVINNFSKAFGTVSPLNSELKREYEDWKNDLRKGGERIVPGDPLHLLDHLVKVILLTRNKY